MLRVMLLTHPRLRCHGELLGTNRIRGLHQQGFQGSQDLQGEEFAEEMLSLRRRHPTQFLEQALSNASDLSIGFKALYEQLYELQHAAALDWLTDERDLRIVHLRRRNGLRRYVSHARHLRDRRQPELAGSPLDIDPEAVLQDIRNVELVAERLDRRFAAHEIHHVAYEDVLSEQAETMAAVLAFLDVENQPLKITTKPSAQVLSESIANVETLRRHPILGPMLLDADGR